MDWYEYQLARYMNDVSVDLRARWEIQWRNIGFDVPQDADLHRSAYINVIKSCIDTIVSKLYNQKVRPYFTPVNGLWKTNRVVDDIQQYFDILFDNQHINKKVSAAFRMACIFSKGYIYINPITNTIEPLAPHQVSVLNTEVRYSTPKRVLLRYLNYPASELSIYGLKVPNDIVTVNLEHYIDTEFHKQILYIDGRKVREIEYKPDVLPLLCIYYTEPVFGENTVSIVNELDGIQTKIDEINAKTSAAIQLSSTTQTYVFEGSNLTAKDLDDRVGTVYGVKMPPSGSNTPPVVAVQQRPFDPEWRNLLDYYIEKASNQIGISQLSQMSKKPSGLDSGTALQTMEDIEADRFETQVTNYIHMFIELAQLLIEILPEDVDILPSSLNNSSLKWKDVKEQQDLFKIQFSAATLLSKDPAENAKMIMQLSQSGNIPIYKFARSLNNPDLVEAYAGAEAVGDGIQQCIANAIENEDYDIPDFVSYQGLAQEITIVENRLYSSMSGDAENDKYIEESLKRLLNLEATLLELMQTNGYVEQDLPEETNITEEGIGVAAPINQAADITNEIDAEPAETPNDELVNQTNIMENQA